MSRRRSITDEEIALIRAMLTRGLQNNEIQFFFNHPDRPVNSGRITNIKDGTYSNSATILPATDHEVDSFIDNFAKSHTSASGNIPPSAVPFTPNSEPLAEPLVKAMFEEDKPNIWHFRHEESERYECKEDFGFKHSGKWLRAIAALANNNGGYVIFGVKDKIVVGGKVSLDSYRVTGLKSTEFEDADPADFAMKLKSTFDPTPRVETRICHVGDLNVGILYVHPHRSGPVIAQRGDGREIKEGDIFFRYPGQSSRIKYSDLRVILDSRDQVARDQILPMIERLLALGPRNAMVADLSEGVLSDEKRSIIIGEELLERIKFIRAGEFDEKHGKPTLRLVGDVQAVKGETTRKEFATSTDIVEDFLNLRVPFDPTGYIRGAAEIGGALWLPMHFYASKAGLNSAELAEFVKTTSASPSRKQFYIDRALGTKSAYQKAGRAAIKHLSTLMDGGELEPNDLRTALDVASAIAGLEERPILGLELLLKVVRLCWRIMERERRSNLTIVRKATARVDELYFARGERENKK